MWRSFNVATKIWLSISILCVGYFITVAYGFFVGSRTESGINDVSAYLLPATNKSQLALTAFNKQIKRYNDAILFGEESFLDSAKEVSEEIQGALQHIVDLKDISPEKANAIKKIQENLRNFTDSAQVVYKASLVGNNVKKDDKGDTLEDRIFYLAQETNKLKDQLALLSEGFNQELKEKLASISSESRTQKRWNVIIFFVVVFGASWLSAIIIKRSVIYPLGIAVRAIEEIAGGDLTKHFNVEMDDEIGQLLKALNKMVENLKEIVRMVSETTMKTNSSASDISVAVEEQAAVAAEQSASVSEITSTMEELSASSTQVAGHSNAVAEIASKALQNTKQGADSVEKVMTKMSEINENNKRNINEIVELGKKSEEITKVMEIINNIADQTKLIAFNAALEASSAGEAGKRFGVVAVEIRRLADSVMESTSETAAKIKEIQEAVNHMVVASEKGSKGIQEGLEYSTQTAAKLSSIVEGSQATADAAKQISLSTQQTKTASEQVVMALREINQGAKQTSDSIKQIGSISRDLTNLAGSLKDLIKKFKL